MVKRFSVVAFIVATLAHVAGTDALFRESFRLLRELQTTGVDRHPVWFTVVSSIWESGYMLMWYVFHPLCQHFVSAHPFDPCDRYRGFILLFWSLCVGAIFGFIVPRFVRWRRQTI